MLKILLIIATALSCFAQSASNPLLGTVSGKVIGEDGTAVAGINVALLLTAPAQTGRPRQTQWTATTGTGGAFQVDDVTDGTYTLCVLAANTTWLDPCEWGGAAPVVKLSMGNRTPNITITLKRGATAQIRVNDSSGVLSLNEGKIPGAQLLIGVSNAARAFRPAVVFSQDSTGRTYQVVVPFDTQVRLVATSSFFKLADANGTTLPPGTTIPLFFPSGQPIQTLKLAVTGGGGQ